MSIYQDYLNEIEERKKQGLNPKPIDGADLITEVINLIKAGSEDGREKLVNFFIYNTIPGTTSAAVEKAKFLKALNIFKI